MKERIKFDNGLTVAFHRSWTGLYTIDGVIEQDTVMDEPYYWTSEPPWIKLLSNYDPHEFIKTLVKISKFET